MDSKKALCCAFVVLFILLVLRVVPENLSNFLFWGCIISLIRVVFCLVVDYANEIRNVASKGLEILGEIPLQATLKSWMSNVNRVTRLALHGIS